MWGVNFFSPNLGNTVNPALTSGSAPTSTTSSANNTSNGKMVDAKSVSVPRPIGLGQNTEFIGCYRWNWDRLPINRFFLIMGGTGTGKTWFANDGLFHMRNRIKAMTVMSNTERSDPMFKYDAKKNPEPKLPDCFVYYDLNIGALDRAVKRLQMIKSNPAPQVKSTFHLNYWDDVLNESSKFNHPIVKHWVWNARHDGGGLWLLIQYMNEFPKKLRKQPHFLALQRPKGIDDVNEIWKTLCSSLCTLEQFQQMVFKYTRNYGTLVVDFLAPSSRLEDHFFYYISTPPEKLGPYRIDDGGDMWKYAWFHEKDPEQLRMNWTNAPWDPNALDQAIENSKTSLCIQQPKIPGSRGNASASAKLTKLSNDRKRRRTSTTQPTEEELDNLQFLN